MHPPDSTLKASLHWRVLVPFVRSVLAVVLSVSLFAHAYDLHAHPKRARAGRLMPSWEDFSAAAQDPNGAQAERLARQLGPAEIAQTLNEGLLDKNQSDHHKVLLALLALPHLDSATTFLPIAGAFVTHPDPEVSRAALFYLRGQSPKADMMRADVPRQALSQICSSVINLAYNGAAEEALRADALSTFFAWRPWCGEPPATAAPHEDRSPDTLPATLTTIALTLTNGSDDEVALLTHPNLVLAAAAVAQACRALKPSGRAVKQARRFLSEENTFGLVDQADIVDMMLCLRGATAQDIAVAKALVKSPSPIIAGQARTYLGGTQAR